MLKILFCLLFLNQISYAEDAPLQEKFSETKLKDKSESEDNINVVPFYSVKDLKKRGVDTVKSEEKTVEGMLQDRVSKYKDVQDSLKYFSDLYKANKITDEKALLEFKWALRVLAKRKDAIVRITKNLKDQSKIEAISDAIETSELESESDKIVQNLESRNIQAAKPKIIVTTTQKKEVKSSEQIKEEQQKAWDFYKNETYLSARNKKEISPEVVEAINPAPIEKEVVMETVTVTTSQNQVEPIVEIKKEVVVVPVENPSNTIITKEVVVDKTWKEVAEEAGVHINEKNIEDKDVEIVKNQVVTTKSIEESPSETVVELQEPPKIIVPEIQALVEKNDITEYEPKDVQATLDLIKKKEQEAAQYEYKYQNLLNKYNSIVKENERKEAAQIKPAEPEIKKVIVEVVKEEPKQLIILDEGDSVQAIEESVKPVQKSVKINSIQEQFQEDMVRDPKFNGESDQNSDEVHYYKGNGLEEDGYLEESDEPQY